MKIFLLSFLLAFTALAETQPKWIWSTNDASSVILYKQIKVSKWIAYSRVYAAGDDEFTLYIGSRLKQTISLQKKYRKLLRVKRVYRKVR